MIEELQYKGYFAEVGISFLEDIIHGKIRGISDLVIFDARTPIGLKEAFEVAVDDYLETCSRLGKEPQKSCNKLPPLYNSNAEAVVAYWRKNKQQDLYLSDVEQLEDFAGWLLNNKQEIHICNVVLPDNIEPVLMQSAFHFENGNRIIVYSSYQNGIRTFKCDEDWKPYQIPFAECPFDWSGHKTMTEYHKNLRARHKHEEFISEHSTKL